ncbi:hypothetical protein BRD56_11425 [Thermoplasmatales archaeon SW_10_69_26]|nr:MAG: hypothetical protein BRD56_11425 [Thermoplasmatales archaeon SW_10_69_26]
MATKTHGTTAEESDEPRLLVTNLFAFLQGLVGLVAMFAPTEAGAALGRGFSLTAGAMMIVGAVGIRSRQRWGWTIGAVFDVVYLVAATGVVG